MCAHRIRRALHSSSDLTHLEILIRGAQRKWQPACTVDDSVWAAYFAHKAHQKLQIRRQRRFQFREAGVLAKRRRNCPTFMAPWSYLGPRAQSRCRKHKETDSYVATAARTAAFLTAGSESGIVVDLEELIGAESVSQRYRFVARAYAVTQDDCTRRRMPSATCG